jgi:hypothetical protein
VKEPASGGKVKDSLLALIGSDMFSVHMLFTHLNRALSEGKAYQVEHLLSGKLSKESIANIDFYLPQLW